MSNVHGFGNMPDNRRPNRPHPPPPPPPGGGGYGGDGRDRGDDNDNGMPNFMAGFDGAALEDQLRLAEEHKVLFVSGRRSLKNPRQQNFWDMLVFGLCPNFSFISITFLLVVIDIILFIYEVSIGLDKASNNLLQVKSQTLIDHGGNYQPADKDGQVYRFLSAIFLHVHFLHAFGNIFVTFMFVSRVQYTFGWFKTLVIYLLSGIAANIFSVVCQPSGVKAGASTSLYGIIGAIIGYILLNWNGLDLMGTVIKCQVYCSAFMIIIFIFIFTPADINGNIDYFGHLGGFLSGMWLTAIHQTIISGKCQKIARVVFICLFVIQVLICTLVLYLGQKKYA